MKDGSKNLVSLGDRSEEERKNIASAGGKASGKARRKKRALKDLLETALSQPCPVCIDEDNWTAICVSLVQKALNGDVKAFEVIRDSIGQKPNEKVEMLNSDIHIRIDDND